MSWKKMMKWLQVHITTKPTHEEIDKQHRTDSVVERVNKIERLEALRLQAQLRGRQFNQGDINP